MDERGRRGGETERFSFSFLQGKRYRDRKNSDVFGDPIQSTYKLMGTKYYYSLI